MREPTEKEKKDFRRLRRAYRWAMFSVLKRRGPVEDMRSACRRITAHATHIGWLEDPKSERRSHL